MAQTILITGAKGYLGGRLVVALADDSALILIGTTRNVPTAPPGWPQSSRLVRLDPLLQDRHELEAALQGVDMVVHLSAPNEVVSANDPGEALVATGLASLKLLVAAKSAGCRRFVYLSTIHVYGTPLQGRISEIDLPRPLHPYAIAHRAAEDYVLAAQARREIEGVVLRLSNGIGAPAWPTVDRWTLIGNEFCRQAIREGRIALHTTGLQWRDFILLRDFTAALRHVIGLPAAALGDGLFNLGGRLPLRIIDVAEIVGQRAREMFGKDIAITRAPAATDESWPEIDYSIERIAATGFVPSPRAALDAEIDATLAVCRAATIR